MSDAIGIAVFQLGVGMMVALPLSVVLGFPLLAIVARQWLRLQHARMALRQAEAGIRYRLSSDIPDPAC
ncbi:MAG: hypothetical protein KC621_05330 [Myxococcales bacterium]|nr:hypothetical protein [Myxococcales bacterium]